MEFSLEQLLISLAKKQLIIEQLEMQLVELSNKYNELLLKISLEDKELKEN